MKTWITKSQKVNAKEHKMTKLLSERERCFLAVKANVNAKKPWFTNSLWYMNSWMLVVFNIFFTLLKSIWRIANRNFVIVSHFKFNSKLFVLQNSRKSLIVNKRIIFSASAFKMRNFCNKIGHFYDYPVSPSRGLRQKYKRKNWISSNFCEIDDGDPKHWNLTLNLELKDTYFNNEN